MSSRGQHCHSFLSLTLIYCRSLGIYTVILLSLLSLSVKMTVSPRARRVLGRSTLGLALEAWVTVAVESAELRQRVVSNIRTMRFDNAIRSFNGPPSEPVPCCPRSNRAPALAPRILLYRTDASM